MSGDVVARASRLAGGIDSGQWDVVREQGEFYGVYKGEFGRRVAGLIHDRREAEFIAAARTLVPELVAEVERLRRITDIIDPESVHREQRDAAYAERDQWKALWKANTGIAGEALRERDEANAEVEKLRGGLSEMRAAMVGMRHTTMCSTFLDHAPESECDCARSGVLAWIDHIQNGADS